VLKRQIIIIFLLCGMFVQQAIAQKTIENFKPVTQEMLENPAPEDWLMFSRTYDAQRYSPLDQINKKNVSNLRTAWVRGIGTKGEIQSIPLVYNGVMYVLGVEGIILALDAATGDLIWQYERDMEEAAKNRARARSKNLAIYENMIISTAPDNFLIALDAQTGELIWETEVADGGQQTAGPIVMNGIIVSGRACQGRKRESCFIAGHDVKTGKELWKFYTVPAMGEPGSETWGKSPDHDQNTASTWGLSGSYDPERNLVLWGIANPVPNTRGDRHGGDAAGTSFVAPADLYSNSTVALVPETGELKWYYQHLPGDDWDMDYTNERTLVRTKINPNPKYVKWINESARGQTRDVTVMIGEGGGLFVNDRATGEFLWATPYPFDTEHSVLSGIDTKTGKTQINKNVVLNEPGEQHLICYWNTVSYWPTSYSPRTNSLYSTYIDNCLDMTRSKEDQSERRTRGVRRSWQRQGWTSWRVPSVGTWTRGCGASRRANSTLWCWPRPGSTGWEYRSARLIDCRSTSCFRRPARGHWRSRFEPPTRRCWVRSIMDRPGWRCRRSAPCCGRSAEAAWHRSVRSPNRRTASSACARLTRVAMRSRGSTSQAPWTAPQSWSRRPRHGSGRPPGDHPAGDAASPASGRANRVARRSRHRCDQRADRRDCSGPSWWRARRRDPFPG